MTPFWKGFEKQAMRIGVKATQPLSAAGRMVGNKPAAGVATAGAFKPNPMPVPVPTSAVKNTATRLGTSGRAASVPSQPMQKGPGVSGTVV